ncbi:MAG TPA: hypothetical protein VFQ36_15400, partial [Ktedonobacteraceae bacterium]|nr:hypothetical protein [Ktedonobacteraceae bacterium]
SHLEGVGNYLAACAAITLVHYTPPPFVGIILPCICPYVKLLMKIRSAWLSFLGREAASQAIQHDSQNSPACEDFVNRQADGLHML